MDEITPGDIVFIIEPDEAYWATVKESRFAGLERVLLFVDGRAISPASGTLTIRLKDQKACDQEKVGG